MRHWRNISYYFQISPVTFVTEKCSSNGGVTSPLWGPTSPHPHNHCECSQSPGRDWQNSDVPKYKIITRPSISLTQQDSGECKQYLAISTDTSVSPQHRNVGGRHHVLGLSQSRELFQLVLSGVDTHTVENILQMKILKKSCWRDL